MKKSIFLLLFSVCFFSGAFAQSKQESIKELIHVLRNDSTMHKAIDLMIPSMINQMQSQMKDSTAKSRTTEIAKVVMESVKEASPKMSDLMVSIYDKYFTEKEINDFIVFYKSPSGQKYISVMPEITKDMMTDMMKNFIPELKKSLTVRMEEWKKKDKK